MTEAAVLTQKDLELVPDPADKTGGDTSADNGNKGGDDKPSDKGGDVKTGGKSDEGDDGSTFSGVDDDAGGKAKGKQEGKQKAEEKPGDSKTSGDKPEDKGEPKGKQEGKQEDGPDPAETPEQKAERERLEGGDWRQRVVDRILKDAKDKLTAAKFEQRKAQVLKQLGRYKSLDEYAVSGFSAQEKLKSGDHKKAPETEEERATWRKENDIPAKPEEYVIPEVAGYTYTDKDQPAIDGFREAAHAANVTQAQAKQLIEWKIRTDMETAAEYDQTVKRLDREDREACHDKMRVEFGVTEFKPHMKIAERLLKDDELFGESGMDMFAAARYYDAESGQWRRLTSNPNVMRGLIGLALDRYGEGGGGEGGEGGKAGNRIKELEDLRNKDYDKYVREGGSDELLKLRQAEEAKAAKRSRR